MNLSTRKSVFILFTFSLWTSSAACHQVNFITTGYLADFSCQATDMVVSGTKLVVATECGLWSWDLAEGEDTVSFQNRTQHSSETYFSLDEQDGLVCASSHNSLQIWDFSGSQSPQKLGSATGFTSGSRDVAVDGNRAYVTSFKSVKAFNVSNPSSPSLLLEMPLFASSPAGTIVAVQARGDLLFVMGDGLDFTCYDVANPAQPITLSGYSSDYWSESQILLEGDQVLVGQRNGISIVDVSNPRDPRLLGSHRFRTHNIGVIGLANLGGLAVCLTGGNTLHAVDISDPTEPIWRAYMTGAFSPIRRIVVWNDWILAATERKSFQAIKYTGPPVDIPPPELKSDANGDRKVDALDVLALQMEWRMER